MKPKKKVLMLWASLADYSVECMYQLSLYKDMSLFLIYQPTNSDAPYNPFDVSFFEAVFECTNDTIAKTVIKNFCLNLQPDLIIMSSWNYPIYMSIAKQCKQKGTCVISTFDNQWKGTIKQWGGIFSSPFFLKPSIDNFFVAGDRQMLFARKLGYLNPLQGYYSANNHIFKPISSLSNAKKFIFVGRLTPIKGIDILVKAYKLYRNLVAHPWDLIICGKGELAPICKQVDGVSLLGFNQPHQLYSQLSQATCLILPSYKEPWGVVIHEAALTGLPIIASYHCGATTFFVRDGQNGFIINPDDESILCALLKMSTLSEVELQRMSQISQQLGALWTSEKWAHYVYKFICEYTGV